MLEKMHCREREAHVVHGWLPEHYKTWLIIRMVPFSLIDVEAKVVLVTSIEVSSVVFGLLIATLKWSTTKGYAFQLDIPVSFSSYTSHKPSRLFFS